MNAQLLRKPGGGKDSHLRVHPDPDQDSQLSILGGRGRIHNSHLRACLTRIHNYQSWRGGGAEDSQLTFLSTHEFRIRGGGVHKFTFEGARFFEGAV